LIEDDSVKMQADEGTNTSSQTERKDQTQIQSSTGSETTVSETNPADNHEDQQATNQELDQFTREPLKLGITLSRLYHRVGAKFGKDATGSLREVVGDVVRMKQEGVRPPDQHQRIRGKYGTNFGALIQGLSAIKLRTEGTMPKGYEKTVLYSKGQATGNHPPNNPSSDGGKRPSEGSVNPNQNAANQNSAIDEFMDDACKYIQFVAIGRSRMLGADLQAALRALA